MSYVIFVWKPTGYELEEREGDPPAVGEELDDGDRRIKIMKVGPSPLPGDSRRCVYSEPA